MYYYDHQSHLIPGRYYDRIQTGPKSDQAAPYIIRHGWQDVIDRTKQKQVRMQVLEKIRWCQFEAYYIRRLCNLSKPYEKHHKNHSVRVYTRKKTFVFWQEIISFIQTSQITNRYCGDALEPTGRWQFLCLEFLSMPSFSNPKKDFPIIVGMRTGCRCIKKTGLLADKLEKKKQSDPAQNCSNSSQILEFIYDNSNI